MLGREVANLTLLSTYYLHWLPQASILTSARLYMVSLP